MLRNDADKSYLVDASDMMRIINKRIQIPDELKHNSEELYEYVGLFKNQQTGKVDYNQLILDVQKFDYMNA